MRSFEHGYLVEQPISQNLLMLVRAIGEYRGRQVLYQRQSPEILETLRRVAMVQSVESSNRIEGVTVEPDRLKAIMAKKTKPKDRSEGEVAGYRDVLAEIHANSVRMELSPELILDFHRKMYTHSSLRGLSIHLTMKVKNEFGSHLHAYRIGMDFSQYITITSHFSLRAILWFGLFCYYCLKPVWRYSDPFNPIRRFHTLDQGYTSQSLKNFWRLLLIQNLSTTVLPYGPYQHQKVLKNGLFKQVSMLKRTHLASLILLTSLMLSSTVSPTTLYSSKMVSLDKEH